jgi:DNA-binding response OmpR family regulator
MGRKILNVGADPQLLASSTDALTSAGFEVISAVNLTQVVHACEEHGFSLAILGQDLSPDEKTRITMAIRTYGESTTSILPLFEPGDTRSVVPLEKGPEALIEAAIRILGSPSEG